MAKDPAFLFYPSDFNDGTQDFTNEEVGAYIRLLLFQFSQGRLPMDRVRRKLGSDFERLWPILSPKFKIDSDGLYFNERLETESAKRKAFSESRRSNINKRYEKEVLLTSSTYEGTSVPHMENENRNSIGLGGVGEKPTPEPPRPPVKKPISERKQAFKETLTPFLEKYGRDMLNEFFAYWTEPNKSNTAIRYESQKFWDLSKRLATWHRNQKTDKSEFASVSAPPSAPMRMGRGNITFTPRNHATSENDI